MPQAPAARRQNQAKTAPPGSNPRGRPTTATDTRAELIHMARELFATHGYQSVTTRQIAQAAGVNAGMIRYYFVDKAGLFETMLRETVTPLLQLMRQQARNNAPRDPADVIALYYQVMAPNPTLPKLIFSALHSPAQPEHQLVLKVFADFVEEMLKNFATVLGHGAAEHLAHPTAEQLSSTSVLQPGVDAKLAQLSCISLAIFPFLLPPLLKQSMQLNFDDEFFQLLAAHQRRLLQQGLLTGAETHG